MESSWQFEETMEEKWAGIICKEENIYASGCIRNRGHLIEQRIYIMDHLYVGGSVYWLAQDSSESIFLAGFATVAPCA